MKLWKWAGTILILATMPLWAVTIIWYSQNTAVPAPNLTDILAYERPSPHGYVYSTIQGLANLIESQIESNAFNFVTNIDHITVTNGITNLSLTANTVLKADANKRIASIANGTGALTNDNAGNFGWYDEFASLTDLNNTSNSIVNQITNLSSIVSNLNTLTVTNGLTNLSLTANSIVKTDAGKQLVSLLNGLGLLTNDGAGGFGWIPLDQLTNFSTITVMSNAYFFSTNYFSHLYVTNFFVISNAYFFETNFFNTIVVSNTATVNQLDYFTNSGTMAPDFSHGYDALPTNASFTFLAPINVDPDAKTAQTTVKMITNSSGSPISAAVPASINIVPNSVMWVTNYTAFTFFIYPHYGTSVYGIPQK